LVLIVLGAPACGREPEPGTESAKPTPPVTSTKPENVTPTPSISVADASVLADFDDRVKNYAALRKRLEGGLKRLPDKASAQQLDANQRALFALVTAARADAKQGDVFVPAMQAHIRAIVRQLLAGRDGPAIKAALMEENPMKARIAVNSRYPDEIPLATMPPDLLAALPRLPENLEFRFVGNRLILLDVTAHLVVDFVSNTFDV
jgi:hypothetical protein